MDSSTVRGEGGYQFFALLPTSAEVKAISETTISITPSWVGGLNEPVGYSVWIDYNDDGDFEDANENVVAISPTLDEVVSATFSVPDKVGIYQLRVSMKRGGIPDSCGSFDYGEVEDYYVSILNDCSSSGGFQDEYISRLQVGSIDNSSTKDPFNFGYENFKSLSTELTVGSEVEISITPTWPPDFFGEVTKYDEGYSVWIDYNNDKDFNDDNEHVLSVSPTRTTPITGVFTVPNVRGRATMRVQMMRNGIPDSCGRFGDGEVEDYSVIITSPTDITSFDIESSTGPASIDYENFTIELEVTYGTDLSELVSSYTLKPGASVTVNSVEQISGVSTNDFTHPVNYTVTTANGSTTQNWVVIVTEEIVSVETDILTFQFNEQTGPATIDDSAHTVSIEVVYGTNLTSLVANFSLSQKAKAEINSVNQVSGTTTNDFTGPVIFTVTAEDGLTKQDWIVTVNEYIPNMGTDILNFQFDEQTGPAIIDNSAHTVDIEVMYGTNLTSLVASFTLSQNATLKIGSTVQVSGSSANDFTNSLTLTVIAEDGTTTEDWFVTVRAAQNTETDILIFQLDEQTGPAFIDNSVHTVGIEVAYGTNLTSLVADFILSQHATAQIDSVDQVSGTSANDFSSAIIYTVVAQDGLTFQNWTVAVTIFDSVIQPDSFKEITALLTGVTPLIVSTGDLDGDGKSDLVVTNYSSNTVSVFMNTSPATGNISFATKMDFASGTEPNSVAIGDLDADGKLDLAVANRNSNTVSILRNNSQNIGSISFESKVVFDVGSLPHSVFAEDLDNDGKVDLAVANRGSNTVSVLRNTSNGTGVISFSAKVDYATGSQPFAVSISDLDGDLKPELIVVNSYNKSVSIFRNTSPGAGTINFESKVDFTTGGLPRSVAIGDLDGDGKPELAVSNWAGNDQSISILRNTSSGMGHIDYAAKMDIKAGISPNFVSFQDFDGNGTPDMTVTNSGISVFMNTSLSEGSISFADKVDYPTGASPWSLSPGDFDNDGQVDMAISNSGSNTISIYRNAILTPFDQWSATNNLFISSGNERNKFNIPYGILFAFDLSPEASILPLTIINDPQPYMNIDLPVTGLKVELIPYYSTTLEEGSWIQLPDVYLMQGSDSLKAGNTGLRQIVFPGLSRVFIRFEAGL